MWRGEARKAIRRGGEGVGTTFITSKKVVSGCTPMHIAQYSGYEIYYKFGLMISYICLGRPQSCCNSSKNKRQSRKFIRCDRCMDGWAASVIPKPSHGGWHPLRRARALSLSRYHHALVHASFSGSWLFSYFRFILGLFWRSSYKISFKKCVVISHDDIFVLHRFSLSLWSSGVGTLGTWHINVHRNIHVHFHTYEFSTIIKSSLSSNFCE